MKDFCLTEDNVLLIDEKDLLIQQIDMLFDTNEHEVYGEIYGVRFFDFIWDLSISANEISQYTEQVIKKYINLFDWNLKVETNILQGTQNDIILINIKLYKYDTIIEKTYKVG